MYINISGNRLAIQVQLTKFIATGCKMYIQSLVAVHIMEPAETPRYYSAVIFVWRGNISSPSPWCRASLSDSCTPDRSGFCRKLLSTKHREMLKRTTFWGTVTRRFYWIKPKLDCIYSFPIDLEPNGRPFVSKLIGKWWMQSDFILN